ncbi:hypothetical protein GGR50DRAFT_641675 [Xylaria sp. CBS 124048]|nr:hypothetical protein GGR50DRAFT_641675 [Xylaria sp. CBS 124048]
MHISHALLSFALLLSPVVSASPLDARKSYTCPATNNGPGRDYPEHSYTSGQVTAAKLAATNVLKSKGENWKPGPQDYPHNFGNREKLPFPCGSTTAEYPLETDGKTWKQGDPVQTLPDRVIFEYHWDKKHGLVTKECGVIRHGPGSDFLQCH